MQDISNILHHDTYFTKHLETHEIISFKLHIKNWYHKTLVNKALDASAPTNVGTWNIVFTFSKTGWKSLCR